MSNCETCWGKRVIYDFSETGTPCPDCTNKTSQRAETNASRENRAVKRGSPNIFRGLGRRN